MSRLLALIKREYWENKGAFRTTPLMIGGIYILFFLGFVFTFGYFDNEFRTLKDLIGWAEGLEFGNRSRVLYPATLLISPFLFNIVLAIVVFFYILGSLYDDRKDRSILFWKSLPASDTLTVASKLLSAMFVIPGMFFAIYLFTMVIWMLIGSIVVLILDGNPWTLFISPSNPLRAWGYILASYIAMAFWALPLYGWLMFVSAISPRVPLLFALVPPAVFAVLQIWIKFLQTFTFSDNLFGIIGRWFSNSPLIISGGEHNGTIGAALGIPAFGDFDHAVTLGNMLDRLFSIQMLVALAVAAAFFAAALWLRHRASDS